MMTTHQAMNTYVNTKNPMKEIEMEMGTRKRTNGRTDGVTKTKKTKPINRSICFRPVSFHNNYMPTSHKNDGNNT